VRQRLVNPMPETRPCGSSSHSFRTVQDIHLLSQAVEVIQSKVPA
jgi:hypothetical protein